ncbi:hypothetical protein BJ165DRAFT_1530094 [Panaeolus papilionaceus]|nr:hypothetical protein BJ165DRAFT_1530094 [Panaeolus papilionaceus]
MAGPSIDLTQMSNPATPMAFLSPDLAFQVTIVNFITVGSAAHPTALGACASGPYCPWCLRFLPRFRHPTALVASAFGAPLLGLVAAI